MDRFELFKTELFMSSTTPLPVKALEQLTMMLELFEPDQVVLDLDQCLQRLIIGDTPMEIPIDHIKSLDTLMEVKRFFTIWAFSSDTK